MFQGLQNGDCKYLVTSITSFERYKRLQIFNPSCDLELVGEPYYKIAQAEAGFTARVDAGHLCTSLISQVIDYHMKTIIDENLLEYMWDQENARTATTNCDLVNQATEAPGSGARGRHRNLLRVATLPHYVSTQNNRLLKAGGGAVGGAVATQQEYSEGEQLTLEQMIGIFVLNMKRKKAQEKSKERTLKF